MSPSPLPYLQDDEIHRCAPSFCTPSIYHCSSQSSCLTPVLGFHCHSRTMPFPWPHLPSASVSTAESLRKAHLLGQSLLPLSPPQTLPWLNCAGPGLTTGLPTLGRFAPERSLLWQVPGVSPMSAGPVSHHHQGMSVFRACPSSTHFSDMPSHMGPGHEAQCEFTVPHMCLIPSNNLLPRTLQG